MSNIFDSDQARCRLWEPLLNREAVSLVIQHASSKLSLVNLISKNANLFFYLSVYLLIHSLNWQFWPNYRIFRLIQHHWRHLKTAMPCSMCGSRGGDRGSEPHPGKSQVIWVSIEISIWTPLEKVGPPPPPPPPGKMLDPLWNLGKL